MERCVEAFWLGGIGGFRTYMLACLCRSLRDITGFYEDRSISREVRWRKMYHSMTAEAGGLPLPQRFMMYNDFLAQLVYMLTR